jgi:predicted TIM-barrel fold metal-dependent hydrolase
VEADRAFNAKYGTSQTLLPLTAPGACILPTLEKRAKLARQANEFMAKMRDHEPDKYGFFAALPSLLDKEHAFKEIAYAVDELKADGVGLFTRYGHDNHYLGHPDFTDIWDELDRREAVVHIHPTNPVDTNIVSPELLQPTLQYPYETATTAADMLMNGVKQSHTKCKIILSHGGGTLPYLIGRPAHRFPRGSKEHDEFMDAARSFYSDVAISNSDNVLSLLQNFAKPGHILFGSDYPYASPTIIDNNIPRLDTFRFEDPEMLQNINYRNALALFPRLAQYHE